MANIPKHTEEAKNTFRAAKAFVTVGPKKPTLHDVDWRQAKSAVKAAMVLESTALGESMVQRYLEELLRNTAKVHERGSPLTPELAPCVWTLVWAARCAALTFPLDEERNFATLVDTLVLRFSLPPIGPEMLHVVDADVRQALSGNGCGRDPTDREVTARLLALCDEGPAPVPRPDEAALTRLGWLAQDAAGLCNHHPPGCRCGAAGGGGGGGGGGGAPAELGWLPPAGAALAGGAAFTGLPPPSQATIFTHPNGTQTTVSVYPPPPIATAFPAFPPQPFPEKSEGAISPPQPPQPPPGV
jgi:hypothetical protein